MSGKAAKTNFGTEHLKTVTDVAMGVPTLDSVSMTTGYVYDIRTPGDPLLKEGSGIMVKIQFDNPAYQTDYWLSLKDSYTSVLSNIGNAQAVIVQKPRVAFYFNRAKFNEGYAELICDNKEDSKFRRYERNRTRSISIGLGSLIYGTRRKG